MLTELTIAYKELLRYRGLIQFLSTGKRKARIFRTILGKTWYILEPLAHIAVYYVFIVLILGARDRYGVNPFVFILVGLAHYQILQKCVAYGSSSILSERNLLLQVRIEPLVFTAVAFNRVTKELSVFIALALAATALFGPPLSWRILFYPFALTLLLILGWSLAVFVGTTTVFIRDLKNATGVILRLLLYLSPVLYSVHFVPAEYLSLYEINPLVGIFSLLRWSLFAHPFPSTPSLLHSFIFITLFSAMAQYTYLMTRKQFTKVL